MLKSSRLVVAFALLVCTVAVPAHVRAWPMVPHLVAPVALDFADERAAFTYVVGWYKAHGIEVPASVQLMVTDRVPFPYYRPDAKAILMNPFTAGVAEMRAHAESFSRAAVGGRLRFVEAYASPDDARESYREFMIIATVHELAHAVRDARGMLTQSFFTEETAAMDVEHAFVRDLIARGVVPAAWGSNYRKVNQLFLDAVRPEILRALPAIGPARTKLFEAEYQVGMGGIAAGLTGTNSAPDEGERVLAIYTAYRIALADAAKPMPVDKVLARWLVHP